MSTVTRRLFIKRLRRPEPEPIRSSRICPDCNLRRTELEFRIAGIAYANCKNCHAKHGGGEL